MKYISEEDVLKRINAAIDDLKGFEEYSGLQLPMASKVVLEELVKNIKNTPGINVIRCVECEYFHKWPCQRDNPEIMGKLCTRKELLSVEELDFCSKGEEINYDDIGTGN